MKHLFVFLLLLIALNGITQNTYYFSSSTGFYSNQITPTQAKNINTPFRSLSTLDSMLQNKLPGVTVTDDDNFLLKAGDEFFGSLTPTVDGTPGHEITIGTYGGSARAIITSKKKIPTWTSLGGNKYASPAITGTEVRQLFINNEFKPVGRWPDDLGSANNYGYLQFDASTTTSITENNWSTITGKPTVELTSGNGDLAFRTNHFRFDVVPINAAVSGNSLVFTLPGYTQAIKNGMGYFLENQVGFLNLNTEWAYNRSTHVVTLYSTVNPSTLKVEVTTGDKLIDLTQADNYILSNITFTGSNNFCLNKTAGSNIYIDNCEFKFGYKRTVNLSSVTGTKIVNSLVDSSLTAGLIVFNYDGDTATIKDTKVKNTMFYPGMGVASMVGYATVLNGPSFRFENNEVINSGYTGLNFQYGSNVNIINNLFNGGCQKLDDGGIIYTNNQGYQFGHTNILVKGNIIENTDNGLNGRNADIGTFATDGFTMAMYGDQYTTGQTWEENYIIGGRVGLYFNDPTNMILKNNFIYEFGTTHTGTAAGLQFSNIHIAGQPYYWYHGGPGELMTNSGPAISGNVVTGNTFFSSSTSTTTPMPAIWFTKQSATTTTLEPRNYGTFDNNKFVYPSSPTGAYFKTQTLASGGGWITKRYTMPNWYSTFSYEQHSTTSPKTFTTLPATPYKLIINRSKATQPYTMDGKKWINAKTGAAVDNNITYLPPYTAAVFLYNGVYTPPAPEVTNQDPSVVLVTPGNNAPFNSPADVYITATASDADGAISKVEFYEGGNLLHTETVAPYGWHWLNVPNGNYSITAVAYDDKGATKTSATSVITVTTATVTPPPPVDNTTEELIKIKAKIKTINDAP